MTTDLRPCKSWAPTEHGTISKSRLHELPTGSVVINAAGRSGPPYDEVLMPITRCRDGLWRMRPGDIGLDDFLGLEWRVLYVPEPTPPKVGDVLTLAQLELLPELAGVADDDKRLWQAGPVDDGLRWQHCNSALAPFALFDTKAPLTLVYLPEGGAE